MKKMILLAALLLPGVSFATAKEAKVSVKGMVCGFCAQGITKKFKAESAVEKVDVSLEKKIVTLDFKDGQDLPDNQIEALLKESGYNVEKIDRTGK
jgi:mercuric ion binding protein